MPVISQEVGRRLEYATPPSVVYFPPTDSPKAGGSRVCDARLGLRFPTDPLAYSGLIARNCDPATPQPHSRIGKAGAGDIRKGTEREETYAPPSTAFTTLGGNFPSSLSEPQPFRGPGKGIFGWRVNLESKNVALYIHPSVLPTQTRPVVMCLLCSLQTPSLLFFIHPSHV